MANPNSAGRDQSRKADRKLREQMGAENQMNAEGKESPKVEAVTTPLSNEAPFATKLQSSLTKAAALYDKGELGVRAAWIKIGEALVSAKEPFVELGKTGANGGTSVDNAAYGNAVKAWVAQWSDKHEKDHPVLAKNLKNPNVRSAAIWLSERWENPVLDAESGEVVAPAARELKACRVQNNPVHCRDAYTRWRERNEEAETPDLDYIPKRTSDGNGASSGGSRSGPTGAQIAKELYEKLLRKAQVELLNERLARIHWQGEAARFKSERDDALAQLRAQSVPVNEPEPDVDYIDLDESEFTEVICTEGVRNMKARGEMAMPGLQDTIKLLMAPKADSKSNGKAATPKAPKAPKVATPAKSPRVIKGAAKKAAKPKGEDAVDAAKAKGAANIAEQQAHETDGDMPAGPSEA
jgi:hypothetical protein